MATEKETKIEKIILNLGGEKVSLTPEQAKKLQSLLNDLFGQSIITIHDPYPVIIDRPYYPWYWYWGYGTPQWTTLYGGTAVYSASSSSLEVSI